MAEPTLLLTFSDLIIRVARHIGVAYYGAAGDEAAQAPAGARDLALCKDIVNDGYRRFFNAVESWNWAMPTFSITFDTTGLTDRVVGGKIWRYRMPDGFYGILIDSMHYSDNSGHICIQQVAPAEILNDRAACDTSGYPSKYALRPLDGDDKRKWEMLVFPDPISDDVLTGQCHIYPNKLVELTDTPNCGPVFDEAVLAACILEAEKQVEDSNNAAPSAEWNEALVRAVRIDRRTAPSRLGRYGGGNRTVSRAYDGVATYTSITGEVYTL